MKSFPSRPASSPIPAFRHEVEVTEALRAGLRRLDEADGLEALLGDPGRHGKTDLSVAFWARPSYALAASVATIGLGVLALVLYGQLKQRTGVVYRFTSGRDGYAVRADPTADACGVRFPAQFLGVGVDSATERAGAV
jgi:hypothetical protein